MPLDLGQQAALERLVLGRALLDHVRVVDGLLERVGTTVALPRTRGAIVSRAQARSAFASTS